MARDVDQVIDYVQRMQISPIEKQIMVNRLEPAPTFWEYEEARLAIAAAAAELEHGPCEVCEDAK